ncbi:MAG TPA: glycosyltransferase family 39 protein, partial [Verrucomicrobiae bacterium]|nr:glycosyltransferase family 39 protein [Verrucomicrobiae bacterium]
MNSYLSKVKLFIQRHPLAMIVLLAIILRVCKLRYAYYGTINELARDLNVVYDILVYHKIPLLGPSASLGGFYFGAFYYYLMVPFVWISNFFAWGAVALSGIFSVLQVIAMYHLLKLWFNNEKMGLLGALITAVCLFDVQNSYYISNPNLLPFFVIVFLYGVTRVLQHTDNWKTNVSTGLAFGMATQLHATALLILPILVLICIVIYRQKINYLRLWPGIVAFAVTFIPYFVYEATHRFVNTTGIIKLGGNHLGLPIKLTSIEALIVFWNSIFFFKSDYFNLFLTNNIAYLILLSALVLFGLALLISYRKKESILVPIISREGKILLASWFIVTTIVMLLYQAVLPEYYFLIFWPLPVIVFVWFTYFVITNFRKLGQVFITLYL